jgi:hypothetical protein
MAQFSADLAGAIVRKQAEMGWPPTRYADPALIPNARKMTITIHNLPKCTRTGAEEV